MKFDTNIKLREESGESRRLTTWGAGSYGGAYNVRRRKGLQYFTESYGASDVAGGFYGDDYRRPDRILTSSQMWEVYRRCSDVRASVDSVVRRVATFDWLVEPKISPQDPMYEQLMKESLRVQKFLERPNKSGQTWQEIMTAFLTDLLCFDAGALELVYDRKRKLSELVPLRASTIIPIVNEHGLILEYEQQITNEGDYFGTVPSQTSAPSFKPNQILFMSLYTNTSSPAGNPLLECLVNEVIALMRANEHAMLALDADEIPQGILVLAGIAGRAAEEAKADLQRLKGQDHKIRIMTTPDPSGIGAKWLELRRSPKDIEMRQVVEDIRKTIYRVFGVMPVEMGMTDGMPRATAQVQMDVSSSHLVTPMIELIQSKINGQILPTLLGEELASLIQFRFDREARLNSTDQKAIAEVHQIYVRNGIMTRNEAREVLGLRPLDGGDIATVDINVGTVPLIAFENSTGVSDVDAVVQAGAADEDEEIEPVTGEELVDAEVGSEELSSKTNELQTRSLGSLDDTGRDQWFERIKELPSEWQNPAGINTIDLRDLGNTVSAYIDEVVKVWRASRKRLVKDLAGKTSGARYAAINTELTRLFNDWVDATDDYYTFAGQIGTKKASELAGGRYDAEAIVGGFKGEQQAFLQAKLLADLRSRLMQPADLSGSKNILLRAQVEEDSVLASFNSEEYRIAMYAGALISLAYFATNVALLDIGSDPMTRWIAVGDKSTCGTCSAADGSEMLVSQRVLLPASGTECFTRCRCILAYS